MFFHLFGISILALIHSCRAQHNQQLTDILQSGIVNKVYPGVAAIAGTETGAYFYSGAFGTHEYSSYDPNSTVVTLNESIFDLASLSKVVATTSAVALLYQRGFLAVEDAVSKHLYNSNYSQNGKQDVTVLNCLLHNAGYQPDPVPSYYSAEFGCPNIKDYQPALDISCVGQVYSSLMAEKLVTAPGLAYVYSDLSFITLQFVVGSVVVRNRLLSFDDLNSECKDLIASNQNNSHSGETVDWSNDSNKGAVFSCYFEAFVRKEVFQESTQWLPHTGYLPPNNTAPACLPTTNDTSYRHTLNQGWVSDSNCYAMGGVCGHAGVFSTAPELAKLLTRLLQVVLLEEEEDDVLDNNRNSTSSNNSKNNTRRVSVKAGRNHEDATWLNHTTVRFFTTEYNASQSSRALGWTTNDPLV